MYRIGFLFFVSILCAEIVPPAYLIRQDRVEEAFDAYAELAQKSPSKFLEELQELGYALLQKGAKSQDPQILALSLLGISLAESSHALDLLEKGLSYEDPQIQQLAVHFIGQIPEDQASRLLQKAMSSSFLSTRMEAAFHMARRKTPHILGHLQSLMSRLPDPFKPYFPSLFALLQTKEALITLKQLLLDPMLEVRIESILQVTRLHRDELLPLLQRKLLLAPTAEQEATCFALAALLDHSSILKIRRCSHSAADTLQLAAYFALYQLKEPDALNSIEEMAKEGNLFAIALLGKIPESLPLLKKLAKQKALPSKMNAAFSLLLHKDPACIPTLIQMLSPNHSHLFYYSAFSAGRTLNCCRLLNPETLSKEEKELYEASFLALRVHLLKEALHLPETTFLELIEALFELKQEDLIPTATALLEQLDTVSSKNLLKKYSQAETSPLIRNYAHLALYRSYQDPLSKNYLVQWLRAYPQKEPIFLRPLLSWKETLSTEAEPLSAHESSQFLMDTFLALAQIKEEENLLLLLETLKHTHPSNRYPLTGLLLRASEG